MSLMQQYDRLREPWRILLFLSVLVPIILGINAGGRWLIASVTLLFVLYCWRILYLLKRSY